MSNEEQQKLLDEKVYQEYTAYLLIDDLNNQLQNKNFKQNFIKSINENDGIVHQGNVITGEDYVALIELVIKKWSENANKLYL